MDSCVAATDSADGPRSWPATSAVRAGCPQTGSPACPITLATAVSMPSSQEFPVGSAAMALRSCPTSGLCCGSEQRFKKESDCLVRLGSLEGGRDVSTDCGWFIRFFGEQQVLRWEKDCGSNTFVMLTAKTSAETTASDGPRQLLSFPRSHLNAWGFGLRG